MLAAALVLTGCGGGAAPPAPTTVVSGLPELNVSSPDFADGHVAVDVTCDGSDRPPTIIWNRVPDGTAELVLDLFDPDAGDFSHWLVYGLTANSFRVPPLPAGAVEGVNGFGRRGYGGPCPPRGPEHAYVIRVIAVGEPLGLAPGANRPDVYRALAGARQLAAGELRGAYRRR